MAKCKTQSKNLQQWIVDKAKINFLGSVPISLPAVLLHANPFETGAKLVLLPLGRKAVGGRSCRLGSRRRGILPRNGARNSESCEQGEELVHGLLLSPQVLKLGIVYARLTCTTQAFDWFNF